MSENNESQGDGRLSFDEAVHMVQQQPGKAAFSAMPVFGEASGDEEQRAEGARIFIIEGDGAGSYRVRFVAGPFFSNAFAANETMTAAEIPERIKELRYLPTRVEEDWLSGQVQILIQKLMQASGSMPAEMPDYANAPAFGAGPEAVFPISFVGRDPQRVQ
jgi:hypothetical protein